MSQQQISTGSPRAHRNHDYSNLFPNRVFPTGDIDVLERGEHLLFIKSYEYGRKVLPPHRRIFILMTRYGRNLEAPGTVTVACVWGLGPTVREYQVWDEQGEHQLVGTDLDGWRRWLAEWWNTHKGGR